MAKNISECVVEKVIDYMEVSNNELKLLKHIFKHEYLRCKLCNVILVPVPKNQKKAYMDHWICSCDFCFITEYYPTYDNPYHYFRSRGLGEHICDEIYCKGCIEKHGYAKFFTRYKFGKVKQNFPTREDYNGDFHEPRDICVWERNISNYINICKQCDSEKD